MVKTLPSNAGATGLNPDWGTKSPCVGKKKKKELEREEGPSRSRIGKLFCKGLENNHFQLRRPYGLCHSYSATAVWPESSHR